ncbi:hypothetical protein ABT143_33625 [Streptomyces sp. NPDC002033]|uniref:hypothetical protein n=1 Tax=unclassified Streptomyces TaxID=2593676 RepID=UPI0033326B19
MHAHPDPPAHAAALRTGYWFESLCHRDAYGGAPELLYRVMLDTPEHAVRLIRL